jgi:Flp pilus assembly protein TadD
MLVDFYHDQADNALRWGNYHRAIEMYHEALSYRPGNARVLAALAALYVRLEGVDKRHPYEKAETFVEQALENASDDLTVYDEIICAWIDVGDLDEAWRVMERAEVAVKTIPYEFYISQASYCIDCAEEAVAQWLERAVEEAPPGAPVFLTIGEMAMANGTFDLARDYLERALACGQKPGQAHLDLGIVDLEQGESAKTEMHWNDAMKIARRNNDQELMERVEEARLIFYAPSDLLDFIMQGGPGPFADGSLPDFLDEELNGW